MTTLQCNTGNYQCGGACISSSKKCLIKASPSANKAANDLFGLIEKIGPDAIVNAAGTTGGAAGAAVAGPVGSIAGDLIASTAAKHMLLLKDAYDSLKADETFQSASKRSKARQIFAKARDK